MSKDITPEQKANKLGFKIGDYCLETKLNEYVGKIKSFVFKDSILTAKCEMKNSFSYHYLCELTNKIIIHTPTQEMFDFVCHKTGQTHTFDNTVYGVTLNEKELIIDTTSYLALKFKDYLIICNGYKEYADKIIELNNDYIKELAELVTKDNIDAKIKMQEFLNNLIKNYSLSS